MQLGIAACFWASSSFAVMVSYTHGQQSMAWHGMAWHGMAWHGMAWHGRLAKSSELHRMLTQGSTSSYRGRHLFNQRNV